MMDNVLFPNFSYFLLLCYYGLVMYFLIEIAKETELLIAVKFVVRYFLIPSYFVTVLWQLILNLNQ